MKNENFFYLFAFLMEFCIVIAFLAVPLFAIKLGASVFQLGVLGTVSALCYTLGSLYLGHLSDILGRKRMLFLGCVSFGILIGITMFVNSIEKLIFLYALSSGVSMALFWPPFEAWIADNQTSSSLSKALGKFNIAWCIGAIPGSLAGGFLFKADYRLPFYATAFLAFFIAGALLFFSPESKGNKCEGNGENDQNTIQTTGRGTFLPIAWIANFASFFTLGILRNLFPKLAVYLGVDSGTLGLLMAVMAISQVGGFLVLAKNTEWQYRFKPIIVSQLLAILAVTMIFFSRSGVLFGIALFFIGVNLATSYTVSIFYSLHQEGRKGQMSGFHEGILGGGFLTGPILGGLVARRWGLRTPYLLCAAVLLTAILLESLVANRKSRKMDNRRSTGKDLLIKSPA